MNNFKKTLVLFACAVLLVVGSIFGTLAYLTDTETVTNTFTVGNVGLNLDEAKVDSMGGVEKATETDVGIQTSIVAKYENGVLVGEISNGDRWKPTTDDTEQEYHLLPGHTYVKDPTVTVDANSEDAYVRMMVTIKYRAEADAVFAKYLNGPDDMFSAWLNIDSTNWIVNDAGEKVEKSTVIEGENSVEYISRTYEFRYVGNDASNSNNGIVLKKSTATPLPALFTKLTVPGAVTNTELAHLADMEIKVVAHAIQADGFADADAAWEAFTE